VRVLIILDKYLKIPFCNNFIYVIILASYCECSRTMLHYTNLQKLCIHSDRLTKYFTFIV